MDALMANRKSVLRTAKETVEYFFTDPLSVVNVEGSEDIDKWHDQLSSAGDCEDMTTSSYSEHLAAYGCLLKTLTALVGSTCGQFWESFSEAQPSLLKSNSETWGAVGEVRRHFLKEEYQSIQLSIEDKFQDGVVDINAMSDDTRTGLHHSIVRIGRCFDGLVRDILSRNDLIEALCKDLRRVSEHLGAVSREAQRVAYVSELGASRYKREKNKMESILRSKLSTHDFFEVLRQTSADEMDNLLDSKANGENVELSPHQIDFSSTLRSVEDGCTQELEEVEDSASSVSWGSRDGVSSLLGPSAGTGLALRAGRAARVSSLRGQRSSLDEAAIADIFAVDMELDFDL